jgi:hypothetical protein
MSKINGYETRVLYTHFHTMEPPSETHKEGNHKVAGSPHIGRGVCMGGGGGVGGTTPQYWRKLLICCEFQRKKNICWVSSIELGFYNNILEPSGRNWLCASILFFKLLQLPLRDTWRETRWLQGGLPGTSWFLSGCLENGVTGR